MPKGICLVSSVATAIATGAIGQEVTATYSLYGTPGLLEMPTAQSAPENALAATFSYTEGLGQVALTFQVNQRLSASFRYANVELFNDPPESGTEREVERGFDLRYRFNNETTYVPAIAVGLRDFLTPGRFQSEYVVASKSFGDNLIVTTGVGWGAMGTRDGFANPLGGDFEVRPAPDLPGGQLGSDQWFRGDAAIFGGVEYQINDRWGVKAEYSTIDYTETAFGVVRETESPVNYGLTYRPRPGVQLGLSYLYGTQLGVSGSFELNPNARATGSGLDKSPPPVKVRPADSLAAQSWDRTALPDRALRRALGGLLEIENITLTGLELTNTTARVRYINSSFRSEAQAAGRTARMMTQVMPPSIDTFILEPERRGIPISAITISRRDIEQLENRAGGTAAMLDRSGFGDAGGSQGLDAVASDENAFSWGLGPYFRINPFSNDGSVDVDLGLSLRGVYQIRPNLVLSGAIEQSVVPPEDDPTGVERTPDIQNVRSDGSLYGNDGVPVLANLTLNHFSRPGTNLYGRVSVGYLERMFGGVSGELLWKPVESSFGLGIEVNQVAQRDTDMGFGFDEYDYDVTTGHVSAYYDLGNGYHTQLDVGRYLAGDWGATVSVDREFDNGWVIGAYVTQTDMSYEDFGSGSYNKGVQVTIPQDFFTGTPTRGSYGNTFRTRVGDGGARLQVDGRLYDVVRGGHLPDLSDTWGRFWR
ncbi:YjbH domain-containing protein [Yoonia sp. SDW83-1]|uniref:YjbH domain-containing protein n=1 Tax=Yoonia sp. SDW83-1 TaxID=3366945 RepID=UPI00398C744B